MNSSILSNAVAFSDGKFTTTSLKIAEVFDKEHFHVIRDIEKLQVPVEWHKSNFGVMQITRQIGNGATRKDKAYSITRDGFTLLVMGFTGAAAMRFKIAYLEEFNRMEAELRRLQAGSPSVPSVAVRESPCSEQPELPLSAPYFIPETTYYGVPVMSTTALAERLGVTPGRIHSALQNNRAGLIDGVDLYRIKNAGELRAGGCGSAWGHMTNRVNLLTETGAGKMRAYLRNSLPVRAAAVTAEPLPPVKAELPPPELNIPRRDRGERPLTCRLRLSELIAGDTALLRLLGELEKAGYEVRREIAEVRYMQHVLQQLDCWRKQFRAASDSVQAVFTKQECACTMNGPAAAGKFRTLY